MKTKFFLAAGLLVTAFGFSQTVSTIYNTGTTSDGLDNTYIGFQAGINNTTGEDNVIIGHDSGLDLTTGRLNVFVGIISGRDVATGDRNTFIGESAGAQAADTTSNSVFVGSQSGKLSIGTNNVYVGTDAGSTTLGSSNSYIGHRAGDNSDGDNNVFLGARTGLVLNGDNNTFIGSATGASVTTGEGNVFIGGNVDIIGSSNDQLMINNSYSASPLIYGIFETDNSNSELKFNTRRVGIGFEGTTDPGFGDFPANTPIDYSDYRLFVRGGILAEEVRVRLQADWADYVFDNDYKLMPLNEVEQYITENGHLPNMPSAEQVKEEGLELGNIVKLQQEKIEELTLHLIEQEKEMKELKAQVQELLKK